MRKSFLSLLFIVSASCVFAQNQVPIFATKEDSAAYEDINRRFADAMKNPRYTYRIDSLSKAFAMIREKAIGYRTVYRPSSAFTRYDQRPTDLKTVTRLSLADYRGKNLPDSIYLMPNLTDLELVNTRIKKLPAGLRELTSLKRITVLNNRPKGRLRLAKNKKVETLVIHDDEVDKRPRSYRRLPSLQMLDLSRCNLTRFPDIRSNKQLRRLILNDNRLSLTDLKGELPLLEELVLTSNAIEEVPANIGSFTGLKKLNLNSNKIRKLASEIGKLQQLEQLSLYKNNLTVLPPELFGLKNLKVIDLYYNQLDQLDPAVINWVNLEILYAANNRLFSLPENLGKLTQLRELYVHHNRISTLPETLGNLDSLRVLRVNNNLLLELPASLYRLKSLENLDIASNQIQTIHEALFSFPQLRILSLKNNPLDEPSRASVIQWARKAMEHRNVVVHLEGAETAETR